MLAALRAKIDKSLRLFLDKAREEYKFHLIDPVLFASLEDFVLREGKRLRPIFLIASYNGYAKKRGRMEPSIYYVSTCIELLHNFMLIHDDIIDRSALRRGKPTMHRLLMKAHRQPGGERLGQDLAIIAGDIVYALAIDAFLSIHENPKRKERALKYFIQTAVFTAMGEFIDTLHGVKKIQDVTEKEIFLSYALKTARYTFDCPLVVGAILAGAPSKDIKALARFGLLIGEAFQIQDDIIGVFDTERNIGKSVLSDIAESKKTILVSHAYRHLPPAQRKKFLSRFRQSKTTHADLLAIRQSFIQAGSLAYSFQKIEERLTEARTILQKLKLRPKYRRVIEETLLKLFQHSRTIAEHNPAKPAAQSPQLFR